jgi:hypothetical protein
MLVNRIIFILLILLTVVVFLEYLNSNIYEGYMAVIGPVISPKEKIVNKPKNTYYENAKVTQDFDDNAVMQDYTPNSIIIQEDPDYVLTNDS